MTANTIALAEMRKEIQNLKEQLAKTEELRAESAKIWRELHKKKVEKIERAAKAARPAQKEVATDDLPASVESLLEHPQRYAGDPERSRSIVEAWRSKNPSRSD